MSWIIDRSTDGLGGVYPREIINFANYSVKEELSNRDNLSEEFSGDKALISGVAIRNAFSHVSQVKVQSYLSEFDSLSKHFERFMGLQTADFTKAELIKLMDGLQPAGEEMIKQLHETGVIAYSTGQVLTSDTKISVPRLFRSGLGIITMGPDRARVLPEPASAMTRNTPSVEVTASRWASLSPVSSSLILHPPLPRRSFL